jgi:stearoyl-CoA desaturase (delta-9 desaturase)
MAVFIFFVSIWYLSLFSQTFFQHRYAAHGAFTMSKRTEKFFFIFSYITMGAHYMSPKTYAILHRLHHAYTDTERDPHSPDFSPNFVHMMLRTMRIFTEIRTGKMEVEEKFKKNLPEWESFDKFASSNFSRLLWLGIYLAFFIMFATSPWQYLLLPVLVSLGMVHGTIINWFAHKIGYANFRVKNASKNLLVIDFLMLGESYHNNHHKRPSAINFGFKWHEIDPVYPIILLFHKLRIIKIPKVAPIPIE